jgi:hypothetical protein
MRLDSALKKSRPQYISAQKISTLFDALDEREIWIIHRFSRLVMLLFHKWVHVRLNHKDACI